MRSGGRGWIVVAALLTMASSALLLADELPVEATEGRAEGQLNRVRLARLQRLSSADLARMFGDAPDGLEFVFLVASKSPDPGVPALGEPGDFLVGGASYRDGSTAALGRRLEAHTTIFGIEDVLRLYPSLTADLVPAGLTKTALVIRIAGMELPTASAAAMTLELGWNADFEKFRFQFTVPPRFTRP